MVKTNVHFPTDHNLLWDAARKCIEIGCSLAKTQNIEGWRKALDWKKRVKIEFRKLQKTKKSGGRNKELRLKYATENYLDITKILQKKMVEFQAVFAPKTLAQELAFIELEYYFAMLIKHMDLVERRLVKGEKIPHNEKVFSLFEPHTKWISKGKAGVVAEFGEKHLIVTDQNNFIVLSHIIADTPDATFTVDIAKQLKEQFGNRMASLSFDKGFSSKEIIKELEGIIPNAVIKQKGKPNKERKEIEGTENFKTLNNAHNAVESNINQLTYHGLDKCRDKGKINFNKYVSLAVLSYNLH
ncbi:transposase, partial [Gelidibacter salicanalis]